MYQISLDLYFIYNVQFQEMICPIIPPPPLPQKEMEFPGGN